jgi:hypothetical protein
VRRHLLALLAVLATIVGLEAQAPARTSGTLTSTTCPGTGCLVLPLGSANGTGIVDVSGSWTGTLPFEVSADNSTWRTPTVGSTTTSANGTFTVGVQGFQFLRVRASSLTGTASVILSATADSLLTSTTVSSSALPTGAATEATLAGVKTGTDKIPASPSQDRTTAAAPSATRLTDGAAFYKPTTPTDTQPVSAASLPLPAGAATAALQTQPGVDIGDVTINNAAGAAAVNVQDGGNSITIDATTLPLPTGASTLAEQQSQTTALQLIDNIVSGAGANITQFGGTNVSTGTGAAGAGIPRVTVSNDSSLAANQSVNVAQIAAAATTTVGAGTQKVGVADSAANAIPSATAAFAGGERGLNTRVVTDQRAGTAVTLNAACTNPNIDACGAGSTAELLTDGYIGNTFRLAASTLTGTLGADYSLNGGTNWSITIFVCYTGCAAGSTGGAKVGSAAFTNPNGAAIFEVIAPPSANKVRLRASVLTNACGGACLQGFGDTGLSPFTLALTAQVNGSSLASFNYPTMVGGADSGALATTLQLRAANPATTDAGVVARIPTKRTYAAALPLKTNIAAGTTPFFTICGSATTTIRVQRIAFDYTIATAGFHADPRLQKTSTATSGGTATVLTQVPLDSTSAAGTAGLVNFYTVLATTGTVVGTLDIAIRFGQLTATVTSGSATSRTFEYRATDEMDAIVLRGTAQCVQGSFGTSPANVPTMTVAVVWTEE